jgi:hypothetical protein
MRHPYIRGNANNAWIGERHGYGANCPARACYDKFGFQKQNEHERFLCRADTDWFITLIQHQHFSVQRSAAVCVGGCELPLEPVIFKETENAAPILRWGIGIAENRCISGAKIHQCLKQAINFLQ